ncbi:MAG: response regulator [Candidatus Lokiarchaeota archaeon]|nr:response regulator [Candidatus Lokiarchaeota archaeon]
MVKKGKILVIEDNYQWSQRFKRILEKEGFKVQIANTKDEGLSILKKEFFHFATIDLQLDESTLVDEKFEGWDLLKNILELGLARTMPTMVVTGFPGDEKEYNNRIKAIRDYGATYFMKKSEWNKELFIETITNAIERLDVRFFNDYKD